MILKLNPHVLYKQNEKRTKIISFELDYYLLADGSIASFLPLLEQGTDLRTLTELVKQNSEDSSEFISSEMSELILFLKNWSILEHDSQAEAIDYSIKNSLGHIQVLNFDKIDFITFAKINANNP